MKKTIMKIITAAGLCTLLTVGSAFAQVSYTPGATEQGLVFEPKLEENYATLVNHVDSFSQGNAVLEHNKKRMEYCNHDSAPFEELFDKAASVLCRFSEPPSEMVAENDDGDIVIKYHPLEIDVTFVDGQKNPDRIDFQYRAEVPYYERGKDFEAQKEMIEISYSVYRDGSIKDFTAVCCENGLSLDLSEDMQQCIAKDDLEGCLDDAKNYFSYNSELIQEQMDELQAELDRIAIKKARIEKGIEFFRNYKGRWWK